MLEEELSLYKALNAGYKRDLNKAQNKLGRYGYEVDKTLSDPRERVVAYNKKSGKLLFIENGTDPNSMKDLKTDVGLAVGKLAESKRVSDAKMALVKAKEKYKPSGTVLAAHSLGGGIINSISGSGDKAITYNAGFTVGQTARPNVTNYRTAGDVVSAFAPASNTTTLKNTNTPSGSAVNELLKAHALDNIRDAGIFV
jgi:hypothetical protein